MSEKEWAKTGDRFFVVQEHTDRASLLRFVMAAAHTLTKLTLKVGYCSRARAGSSSCSSAS